MPLSNKVLRAIVSIAVIVAVAACCVGALSSGSPVTAGSTQARLVSVLVPYSGVLADGVSSAGRVSILALAAAHGCRLSADVAKARHLAILGHAPGCRPESLSLTPLRI